MGYVVLCFQRIMHLRGAEILEVPFYPPGESFPLVTVFVPGIISLRLALESRRLGVFCLSVPLAIVPLSVPIMW